MRRLKKLSVIILAAAVIGLTAILFFACDKNAQTSSYTIEYISQTGGSITGTSIQTVKHGENGTQVVAVPDTGYEFVKWSDGVTTQERTDNNITESKTYTAEFRKKTYIVQYFTQSGGYLAGTLIQNINFGESGTQVIAMPYNGYEFVKWSDGKTEAERTDCNITENKSYTAEFKKKQIFSVTYKTFNAVLGDIQDIDEQTVYESITYSIPYGENSPRIFARSNKNFINEEFEFLYWSDGVTTQERQDFNITEDKTLIAYWGYRIDYKVNNNIGGKIEGKTTQKVLPGEIGEEVRAVADVGYTFVGWSNLTWNDTTADDPNHEWGLTGSRNLEIIAYFEPTVKTFTYDLCYEIGAPFKPTQVTIDRNSIDEAEFNIPQREGYTFCGWYADKEYITRITTETGRYMFGYAAFSLETDTLYARWEKEDEKTDNHKILMVFVDEVNTTLYSSRLNKDEKVESKMVAIDYELAKWTVLKMHELLNNWFKGKIAFEVDGYYTTKPVTEGFESGMTHYGILDYNLFATDIMEIGELNWTYHNTLTTISCRDYEGNFFQGAGSAERKNACVNTDSKWYACMMNNILPQERLEEIIIDGINSDEAIYTYLHEFVHTAELYYPSQDVQHNCLHKAEGYAATNCYRDLPNTVIKPLLLCKFEMNGILCGIPMEYWQHKISITINYFPRVLDQIDVGSIKILNTDEEANDSYNKRSVVVTIQYGSDFTVEAIPDAGYKFVCWSDGVKTAKRCDKNIIASFHIGAIFEKI